MPPAPKRRMRPGGPRALPPPLPALCLAAVVALCLAAALPAGAWAADAARHSKPAEDQLIRAGYRFAGEKYEDKFPEIPGDETNIRIFKKGQETLGLYILPGGQVYGYAVKVGNQPLTAFIDEYNTGTCEKDYGDGESFRIDFPSYRAEPGFRQRSARRRETARR